MPAVWHDKFLTQFQLCVQEATYVTDIKFQLPTKYLKVPHYCNHYVRMFKLTNTIGKATPEVTLEKLVKSTKDSLIFWLFSILHLIFPICCSCYFVLWTITMIFATVFRLIVKAANFSEHHIESGVVIPRL